MIGQNERPEQKIQVFEKQLFGLFKSSCLTCFCFSCLKNKGELFFLMDLESSNNARFIKECMVNCFVIILLLLLFWFFAQIWLTMLY